MITKESNELLLSKAIRIALLFEQIVEIGKKEKIPQIAFDHIYNAVKELNNFGKIMQIESGELQ